jgi:DNA-binding response OmpR family regulator
VKILIAEDEPQVAQQLSDYLVQDGYQTEITGNGEEAQRLAEQNQYDAFLCDAMLPGRDGFNVVRHLRRKNINIPVIMVTARTDVKERVRGLDLGADDYLIKPFAYPELLARLRALLRRAAKEKANVIRVADLELDLLTRLARRAGQDIHLTTREFELLHFMMISSPRSVTKSAIIEHVWDEHFDPDTNVVNVYVNYLRRKIERPGLKPLIHTVRSMGFALREEPLEGDEPGTGAPATVTI